MAGTGVLLALLLLGLGLIAAPFLFSMFDRAPAGGEMIDEFRPFMRQAQVDKFRGFLAEIDASVRESATTLQPAASTRLGVSPEQYATRAPYLAALQKQWPGIDADMSDMLDRMQRNLERFEGVDALPPFPLFPWFFVIPGVLVVGLSGVALARRGGRRTARGAIVAIVAIGIGLLAAPAVFQMFTRAPGGGEMIDDFGTLMTRDRVTTVQGYFLTLGNGESDLRTTALPDAGLAASATPATDRLVTDWPRINREMSPFVGVMADNLDNFAAVNALPPFALFPWFFVVPGALLAGLGVYALARDRRRQPKPDPGGHVSSPRKSAVVTAAMVVVMTAVVFVAPLGAQTNRAKASGSKKLVGTFTVVAATGASGAPTSGSYFRMVQPNGNLSTGPFVPNADSTLTDKTYTAVQPGTDDGLVTGTYQPDPNPAFDAAGNGVADQILQPQPFFGVKFAVATNKTDPQSRGATKVPSIVVSAKGALSGNLGAYGVAYGKQNFNQGAPKPDGSKPGLTSGPKGTYSAKTGKYTIEWSSAVVGGPFDGFTGVWHLEGTFEKK